MRPRSTQLYFAVGTEEMNVRASDQLKRVADDLDVKSQCAPENPLSVMSAEEGPITSSFIVWARRAFGMDMGVS